MVMWAFLELVLTNNQWILNVINFFVENGNVFQKIFSGEPLQIN